MNTIPAPLPLFFTWTNHDVEAPNVTSCSVCATPVNTIIFPESALDVVYVPLFVE
jgi:hypothetical protein